jgi:hypothetical protein
MENEGIKKTREEEHEGGAKPFKNQVNLEIIVQNVIEKDLIQDGIQEIPMEKEVAHGQENPFV